MDQEISRMGKENERFITDNLKPDQAKRLYQITLQQQGRRALGRHDRVVKQLSLTDDQ
jgi:hypothetical protein